MPLPRDGAIALYRRPNSAMWYARCKLDDGVALNPFSTGTDDEREAVKIAKKRMLYAEVDRERGIEPGGKSRPPTRIGAPPTGPPAPVHWPTPRRSR